MDGQTANQAHRTLEPRIMKPLYIVGTQRDVGKTTVSIGLVHELCRRGLRVAYTKPVGQRTSQGEAGLTVHADERVIARLLQPTDVKFQMAIPIMSGRVEDAIYNFRPDKEMEKLRTMFAELQADHDVLIIEAMGHVAMGSVLGLSAADIARQIGARAILVSGGGIGRAIDDISLCGTFISARGADLLGVIVNKIWIEKYARVKAATSQALANLNFTSLGAVPYQPQLAHPTMRQVSQEMGGRLLAGQDHLDLRVQNTIVAAMRAEHMVEHIEPGTLVVTPGDRTDNIKAAIHSRLDRGLEGVIGLLLTGGFEPEESAMAMILSSPTPVILVEESTYIAANRLRDTVFKITPDDKERIQYAVDLVAQHVDVDAIVRGLQD